VRLAAFAKNIEAHLALLVAREWPKGQARGCANAQGPSAP
jgi:hypothetical protein